LTRDSPGGDRLSFRGVHPRKGKKGLDQRCVGEGIYYDSSEP